MSDCIFCKIIAGTIPSATVLETPDCLAFLDINPAAPGHTLVIPRAHHADLLAMPSELAGTLIRTTQRVARGVLAATGASAFHLQMNNGAASGQLVLHAHFHVIPRQGGGHTLTWQPGKYAAGALEKMRDDIRAAIPASR